MDLTSPAFYVVELWGVMGLVRCTLGTGMSACARPETPALLMGHSVRLSPTKGVPVPRVVCSVLSRLPRNLQGSSANYPCQVLLGTDPLCSWPQGTCPGGPEPFPSCGPSRAGQSLGSFGGRESMSDSESKPWAQVPAQHLRSCGNQDCSFVDLNLSLST